MYFLEGFLRSVLICNFSALTFVCEITGELLSVLGDVGEAMLFKAFARCFTERLLPGLDDEGLLWLFDEAEEALDVEFVGEWADELLDELFKDVGLLLIL